MCVFVALGIQHAMRMRRIIVCDLPRSTIFFQYYLINDTILGEKLLNTKRVFCYSLLLLSETFLILGRNGRDIIKNVYWSLCEVPFIGLHVKYPLFILARF